MNAIVFNRSNYERFYTLYTSGRFPYAPSSVEVGLVSVFLHYDSLIDLSLASTKLYTAGILHRCVIL